MPNYIGIKFIDVIWAIRKLVIDEKKTHLQFCKKKGLWRDYISLFSLNYISISQRNSFNIAGDDFKGGVGVCTFEKNEFYFFVFSCC